MEIHFVKRKYLILYDIKDKRWCFWLKTLKTNKTKQPIQWLHQNCCIRKHSLSIEQQNKINGHGFLKRELKANQTTKRPTTISVKKKVWFWMKRKKMKGVENERMQK